MNRRAPFRGVDIPPCWSIVPPERSSEGDGIRIIMNPGPGFGDGTHETTQLCLQAIATTAPRGKPFRMLDFGSGSGILSIAAAKLGATVEAVDIEELAIESSVVNARLNGIAERIHHARTLEGIRGPFDMIVANILRPVLLDFAGELAGRRAPAGALVLSGLVSTDVPAISARYAALLSERRPEVYERGAWRALLWRR